MDLGIEHQHQFLERTDGSVPGRRVETMEKHIGRVTHYFERISVAVLDLSGGLKVGDLVHIQGHTTDFTQPVKSMEIEHQKVQSVGPGADVALKVIQHVREGDLVYVVEE
jgi:translation elongation factor EF-1alpha